MKNFAWVALVAIVCFIAFFVRMWQCEEMFPNASLLACLLWK